MYGYELDYGYEPATEGIGSFFEMVGEKIKQFAEFIRKKMGELKLKIQRMTGTVTADQSKTDSAEASKKITEIGDKISDILDKCCDAIDELYTAFEKVAKTSDTEDKDRDREPARTKFDEDGNRTGYEYMGGAFRAKNGMNQTRSNLTNAEQSEWTKEKARLGEIFATQAGLASQVSADLKSLKAFGPLTLSATKKGYDELRGIFNANGTFGMRWKKVKIAAEWSTGFIKESLNKIVKMYDVGVNATKAFGNRLSSGNFRDEEGKKMTRDQKRATRTEYAIKNKVYNDKGNYDVSTNRKAKDFYDIQRFDRGAESASILDRLYDMAYEDVMNDLAYQQYACESYDAVPGAFEFVDDYGYDPSLDPDL